MSLICEECMEEHNKIVQKLEGERLYNLPEAEALELIRQYLAERFSAFEVPECWDFFTRIEK